MNDNHALGIYLTRNQFSRLSVVKTKYWFYRGWKQHSTYIPMLIAPDL